MNDTYQQDWVHAGQEVVRPKSFQPLRDGVLKLTWPSGAIAILAIDAATAARKAVAFELAEDGSLAHRIEFSFADCFGADGDGEWDPFMLSQLAKDQGQPFE